MEQAGRGRVLIDGLVVATVDYWIEEEEGFIETHAFGRESETLPTVGQRRGWLLVVDNQDAAGATTALFVAQSWLLVGEGGNQYQCFVVDLAGPAPDVIWFQASAPQVGL